MDKMLQQTIDGVINSRNDYFNISKTPITISITCFYIGTIQSIIFLSLIGFIICLLGLLWALYYYKEMEND